MTATTADHIEAASWAPPEPTRGSHPAFVSHSETITGPGEGAAVEICPGTPIGVSFDDPTRTFRGSVHLEVQVGDGPWGRVQETARYFKDPHPGEARPACHGAGLAVNLHDWRERSRISYRAVCDEHSAGSMNVTFRQGAEPVQVGGQEEPVEVTLRRIVDLTTDGARVLKWLRDGGAPDDLTAHLRAIASGEV